MDDIKKTINLGKSLSLLRQSMDELKLKMDDLKRQKDEVQAELMEKMQKHELVSLKTDSHTFSVVKKNNPVIIDENLVLAEIKKRRLSKELMTTKIDKVKFNSFINSLYKEGEVIDGVSMEQVSYISVRKPKPSV